MMKRLILLLLLIYPCYSRAHILLADLSTYTLTKDPNFYGHPITISGVLEGECDIIVLVKGPPSSYKIWEKKQFLGLWYQAISFSLTDIVSFYYIASNKDWKQDFSDSLKKSLDGDLDIKNQLYKQNTAVYKKFIAEFIKVQEKASLYPKGKNHNLVYKSEHIFRHVLYVPKAAKPGRYDVYIYAISNDKVVAKENLHFLIEKSALDEGIDNFLQNSPFLYALTAILISISFGALAAYIFRPREDTIT